MSTKHTLDGDKSAASRPFAVPRQIVRHRSRPTSSKVPPTHAERNQMLQFVRHYVAEFNPVPPLPLDHLREHARRVVRMLNCSPESQDYAGVLINNEMWREALACVPYKKRLLLLPKCLRVEKKCPAPFDEFGLLCRRCGLCSIQDLQSEAEHLGYAVLVAEGSAVVMSLIQTGKIEAVVGVSCLAVLEKAFAYMEAAAIPGLAIPLLQDDCADTTVDLEWVWDYLHLTSDDQTRRLDLGSLRTEVESWFATAALDGSLGEPQGETERIAREWLARAGKRWRPFLTVAAFQALSSAPGAPLPAELRKLAVAVECFHKASLIHDDIEDGDAVRYGEKTLHEEHGLAVALNVGDLLVGEGYRLLGQLKIPAAQQAEMLRVASAGQRQLCQGQGAELCWAKLPKPLSALEVLQIFRQKTAPAFEVALKLGAIFAEGFNQSADSAPGQKPGAGTYAGLAEVLRAYSEALGIAYQIRDDLADYESEDPSNDLASLRPSLLLATACEKASGADKALLESLWRRVTPSGVTAREINAVLLRLKADERARALLETYKEEAVRSLRGLENPNLKGLLRRVIGRIFNDPQLKGWCKEVQSRQSQTPEAAVAGFGA